MNSDDPIAMILTELDATRPDEIAPSLEAFQKAVSHLDELDLQDVEPAVMFRCQAKLGLANGQRPFAVPESDG